MKWPWQRRAEQAEKKAEDAVISAEESREEWLNAVEVAIEARRQREMNGWTGHVLTLFRGMEPERGSR